MKRMMPKEIRAKLNVAPLVGGVCRGHRGQVP